MILFGDFFLIDHLDVRDGEQHFLLDSITQGVSERISCQNEYFQCARVAFKFANTSVSGGLNQISSDI